ncbi:hypothetical protein SISNIDRAFT_498025 [Sistotremastrum niveocremeum HHB9708]|uniref:Uncharacterized protein n=2 Tax=Sistotremastraceae TaxID=3402574 RepID=A0A164P7G0_9AGAM|nr:hypothetical protein SISNIDRAFT_498025 [Sistotremastrum niveocremeum HHB9708]KZT35060.1 hypothetical protein SISSUDRAFT_1025848 [Sistotremastrum suecicum HHB10207 ss-3]
MKFAIPATVLSLFAFANAASVLPRQAGFCPEASRFGILGVKPTNLSPGDKFTITANFTCGINQYNIVPKYIDYYIEVPENVNNGHEPPILLARRTFSKSHGDVDKFTTHLPDAFYFTGAAYTVQMDITYAINGTLGKPFYVVGGTEAGVNITDPNSI